MGDEEEKGKGDILISCDDYEFDNDVSLDSDSDTEALLRRMESDEYLSGCPLVETHLGEHPPLEDEPLDEGFGAIVQSCKDLRRLSLSGLLTDRVFQYIGTYAENLDMLSVAFAGNSDVGMLYVLNGCKKLSKLEIRDSPFGNVALLKDVSNYETMRSLWMSSCEVTMGGCKMLAKMMPRLNVEVINDYGFIDQHGDNRQVVDKQAVRVSDVGWSEEGCAELRVDIVGPVRLPGRHGCGSFKLGFS